MSARLEYISIFFVLTATYDFLDGYMKPDFLWKVNFIGEWNLQRYISPWRKSQIHRIFSSFSISRSWTWNRYKLKDWFCEISSSSEVFHLYFCRMTWNDDIVNHRLSIELSTLKLNFKFRMFPFNGQLIQNGLSSFSFIRKCSRMRCTMYMIRDFRQLIFHRIVNA